MNTEKTFKPGKRAEEGNLVATQTGNHPAWEAFLQVRVSELSNILIPADLAARAAFLAQVHRGVLSGMPARK